MKRVAVLYNPATAPYTEGFLQAIAPVAQGYGMTIAAAPVRDVGAMQTALAELAAQPNSGLLVPSDAYTYSHAEEVVAAAARHRLPAIYAFRIFAASGGLMSYGVNLTAEMRQAAAYVDRVLNGDKPARPARAAAEQVRADRQPQGGQGAGHPRAAGADRAGGRSDRVRL